jgi:aquaporin Z
MTGGFAANGFDTSPGSPGQYTVLAAFVTEVVMTFFFLIVIIGSTHRRAPAGFAPLAIGLCLTLIHLITIPVTNTSVNPARSTGPAVLVAISGESWAVSQLWLFWVAPILGALLAGFLYTWLAPNDGEDDAVEVVEEIVVVEEEG